MRGLINANMFTFGFKGIDHSKKLIPLLFIHPQVVLNVLLFYFAEQTHKKVFGKFWFLNILNHPLIIHILSLFDINNVRSVTLHYIPGSIFASSTVISSSSSPLHLPSVCAMLPQSQLVLAMPDIPYWNTSNSIGKPLHSSTSSTLSFSWSVSSCLLLH